MSRFRRHRDWCLFLPLALAACGGESDSGGGSGGAGGSGGTAALGGAAGSGGSGGIAGSGGVTGGTGGVGGSAGSTGLCSLSVIASGKLPDPVAPNANLTGPSIVATDDLFVIGYREQSGDQLNTKLLSLTDTGSVGAPDTYDLGGCASVVPKDGTGIAFAAGQGMFVTSLPDCGKGAGAVFIPFDSKGVLSQASGPRNPSFTELTVAQSGSVAPAAATGEYEFVYRVVTSSPPVVERVVLAGPAFKSGLQIAHPFGDGLVDFGMVATSVPGMRALAGAVPGAGLELHVGPAGSDTLQEAGKFMSPPASSAALAAWKSRAATFIPAPTGVLWKVYEVTGPSSATEVATGAIQMTQPASLAVAVLGDLFALATGEPKQITVRRNSGANGQPYAGPAGSAVLSGSVGAASLDAFDGTHVAIAAARNKVALVWLSKHALTPGDATGGWALLDCAAQ